MNYETFKHAIAASVQNYFGKETSITLHPIIKNNNVTLDGLTIQEQSVNISPTIYLNYYYEDYQKGKKLTTIRDEILQAYQNSRSSENMDLSFFTDYQKVKYRIVYKIIHYEKNKKLLENIPHFPYLDFAIVFCCLLLNNPGGNATILIHNHHLDYWHITAKQLFSLAQKNTPTLLPTEIKSMEDILKEYCSELPVFTDAGLQSSCIQTPSVPMYVLTNTVKLFGASCILYPQVLSDFAQKMQSDLYVIPSSIHEVLLIPAREEKDSRYFNHMIQDVNSSQVQDEEILSDHVYYFSRKDGLLIP